MLKKRNILKGDFSFNTLYIKNLKTRRNTDCHKNMNEFVMPEWSISMKQSRNFKHSYKMCISNLMMFD